MNDSVSRFETTNPFFVFALVLAAIITSALSRDLMTVATGASILGAAIARGACVGAGLLVASFVDPQKSKLELLYFLGFTALIVCPDKQSALVGGILLVSTRLLHAIIERSIPMTKANVTLLFRPLVVTLTLMLVVAYRHFELF